MDGLGILGTVGFFVPAAVLIALVVGAVVRDRRLSAQEAAEEAQREASRPASDQLPLVLVMVLFTVFGGPPAVRLQERPRTPIPREPSPAPPGSATPTERKDRSVIAVTCRNGEHFSIDPAAIERVETTNDVTLHMVDGSKYVIDQGLDALVVAVRDHRAAAVVARNRLVDGAGAAATRHARRSRGESPFTVLPDRDED